MKILVQKFLWLFLLFSLPSQAGFLNTVYDAKQITVNVGTDNVDGHAVLYMKGIHQVTSDPASRTKFCVLLDPIKLSTMQGIGDMTLYGLIWNVPSCADTDNVTPCIPDGAVVILDSTDPWCLP